MRGSVTAVTASCGIEGWAARGGTAGASGLAWGAVCFSLAPLAGGIATSCKGAAATASVRTGRAAVCCGPAAVRQPHGNRRVRPGIGADAYAGDACLPAGASKCSSFSTGTAPGTGPAGRRDCSAVFGNQQTVSAISACRDGKAAVHAGGLTRRGRRG